MIIEKRAQGIKPSVISRELRVSHGCVSKIIQRYQETGSITPGVVGGPKTKPIDPTVEEMIRLTIKNYPNSTATEIRNRLIEVSRIYCFYKTFSILSYLKNQI